VLTSTFTEGGERNRALGAWGAMGGAGGAVGSLLGGVLTDALSWRWILFINIPIGLLAGLAAQRFVAESRADASARRAFDATGAVTVTAGLVAIVYGIVRTDKYGWGSANTLVALGIGLALLVSFFVWEGRLAKAPLVPLRVFRSRQLSAANLVVFMLGASAFAMWYFMSLYLQEVRGFSPIKTGFAFLPGTIALAATAQMAGKRLHNLGPGRLLTLGMGLIAIGLIWLGQVSASGSYASDVLVPFIIAGAGIGITFVSVTVAGMAGVRPNEVGLASGLINTSRQIGGSLGLAILATIATSRTSNLLGHTSAHVALTKGFDRAFVLGGIFAGVGALASALLIPLRRPPQRAPAEAPVPESVRT
jgi:predicted MFS family arabinose efflux permease